MNEPDIRRVGILTGGGDCPGLNSVIRAVTKCAIVDYGLEVFGVYDSFDGLIGEPRVRGLRMDDVKGLLFRGGTILGSTNKGDPFKYSRLVCGNLISEDLSSIVMENIDRLGLGALIVIGGDGTMAIANKFVQHKGLRIIGVPKTIDNDIPETDRTFGFDTAVAIATEAIDRLQTTASSHHRILVVETMGRNAGWIALEAGLAGGADVILIPEIPFRVEAIVDAINEREACGRRSTIICASEGARAVGGKRRKRRVSGTSPAWCASMMAWPMAIFRRPSMTPVSRTRSVFPVMVRNPSWDSWPFGRKGIRRDAGGTDAPRGNPGPVATLLAPAFDQTRRFGMPSCLRIFLMSFLSGWNG